MNREVSDKNEKVVDLSRANFDKDPDYQILKAIYSKIKSKYNLRVEEIVSKLEKKEILLPSCIFNEKISVFEAIIKYLKENVGLANNKIAEMMSKSQKSIWQAYNNSQRKFPLEYKITLSDYHIPISALDPSSTVLECVVRYLKDELMLSYHEIGVILKRDDRTVWTVYQRIKRKQSGR